MSEFDALVSLVTKMPQNYKKTVKEIQPFLHDDEISDILASPDYMTANGRIITIVLSYSAEHSDMLSLCDILESVTEAPELTMLLRTFRRSKYSTLLKVISSYNCVTSKFLLYKLFYTINTYVHTSLRCTSLNTAASAIHKKIILIQHKVKLSAIFVSRPAIF